MRREVHWTIERENGTSCEVRVKYFGKKFKFQYLEIGPEVLEPLWDYNRKPTSEDYAMLLDIVQRRYQRRQAGENELNEAKRLAVESSK